MLPALSSTVQLERWGQDVAVVKGYQQNQVDFRLDFASAFNEGDPGSIPGLGRSPGEGNGNPLQYSCLENPMDGEAW